MLAVFCLFPDVIIIYSKNVIKIIFFLEKMKCLQFHFGRSCSIIITIIGFRESSSSSQSALYVTSLRCKWHFFTTCFPTHPLDKTLKPKSIHISTTTVNVYCFCCSCWYSRRKYCRKQRKKQNKIKMIINESSQQAEDPEKAIKERPIIKKFNLYIFI